MPKYQVCPYCRTVYRYKDIVSMRGKVQECYHCKKQLETKKAYKAIPVAAACVLMVIVNLILFHTTADISKGTFTVIVLTDAAVIFTAFVISPLFVRLKKLPRSVRKQTRQKKK